VIDARIAKLPPDNWQVAYLLVEAAKALYCAGRSNAEVVARCSAAVDAVLGSRACLDFASVGEGPCRDLELIAAAYLAERGDELVAALRRRKRVNVVPIMRGKMEPFLDFFTNARRPAAAPRPRAERRVWTDREGRGRRRPARLARLACGHHRVCDTHVAPDQRPRALR
jgi:hypothetical protein